MRISRSTGALSGLLIILLAVWGGIVPFVGPYFHFSFGSNASWHYTTNRLWLDILPAAVAVLGGLALIRSGHRVSGVVGGWIALAAGAWFVAGPSVSLIWEHHAGPIGTPLYGDTRQAIELIGYFYGVGALIIALAAFALGRVVTRPALVAAEPVAAEPVATTREPVATTREPVATTPEPATATSESRVRAGLAGDSMAPSVPVATPEATPAETPDPAPVTLRRREGGLLRRGPRDRSRS